MEDVLWIINQIYLPLNIAGIIIIVNSTQHKSVLILAEKEKKNAIKYGLTQLCAREGKEEFTALIHLAFSPNISAIHCNKFLT